MNLSEIKAFIERHGGHVDDTGHETHGDDHTAFVYADMPHHTAANLDMPENITVEDWGDKVLFEADVGVER